MVWDLLADFKSRFNYFPLVKYALSFWRLLFSIFLLSMGDIVFSLLSPSLAQLTLFNNKNIIIIMIKFGLKNISCVISHNFELAMKCCIRIYILMLIIWTISYIRYWNNKYPLQYPIHMKKDLQISLMAMAWYFPQIPRSGYEIFYLKYCHEYKIFKISPNSCYNFSLLHVFFSSENACKYKLRWKLSEVKNIIWHQRELTSASVMRLLIAANREFWHLPRQ